MPHVRPGDLVVFDVDGVLVQPELPFWGESPLASYMRKKWMQRKKLSHQFFYSTFCPPLWLRMRWIPVEKNTAYWLKQIQKKSRASMACTNCYTGTVPPIQSMEAWRYAQLKAHTLRFEKHAPIFQGSLPGTGNETCRYYNGILFAASHNKGKVLASFLAQCKETFQRIVVIDDRKDVLEKIADNLTTPHLLLHFTPPATQKIKFAIPS